MSTAGGRRRQSRQKSLNRVGASSVYRTVCWIDRWPSQSWIALVSWPAFASAYPQPAGALGIEEFARLWAPLVALVDPMTEDEEKI